MPSPVVYSNLSPSSTIFSAQSFTQRMRSLANMTKPVVDIVLEGNQPKKMVHTFSTLDAVKGTVSITSPHDFRFDELEISFVGFMKTYVERVGSVSITNNRSDASHAFLKLVQPIDETSYPQPRVLEAGKIYTFPFTFVIPQNLLISSCNHRVANSKLRDAHLQLPPSLGDPQISGTGSQMLSDMTPDMTRITYSVRSRLIRFREKDGLEMTMASSMKRVRVIPAVEEQPPVDIDGQDEEIRLRTEKSIRKGLFKGKHGRIIMEAEQPKSFRLPAPNSGNRDPVNTVATVSLRFEPIEADSNPPRLGSLKSRLKVATFYATTPRSKFPTKAALAYEALQTVHVDILPLSSRCMSSAHWERHEPQARRDSEASTAGPLPSDSYCPDKPFYTARLVVPLTLPAEKTFLPTFHSCLISRVYIIDVHLTVLNVINGFGTTLTLKIPVQVSSAGSHPTIDAVAPDSGEEERAADDFFTPRSIAPPPLEFLQTSSIPGVASQQPQQQQQQRYSVADPSGTRPAPPDYSYLAPRRASVPVH